MSESLYNIQQDMVNIFFELEENGGELTPELQQRLKITQDNLATKAKAYLDYIKELDVQIDAAKNEKARVNNLQQIRANKRKRLADSLIEAINNFGNLTKSGVRFVEGLTYKISARPSTVIELNTELIQAAINHFIEFTGEFYDNNLLGTDDLSLEDAANYITVMIVNNPEESHLLINNNSEEVEEYNRLTVDDLLAIKVNISVDTSIADLCQKKFGKLLEVCQDLDYLVNVQSITDKTTVKNQMADPAKDIKIGNKLINYSLQIK